MFHQEASVETIKLFKDIWSRIQAAEMKYLGRIKGIMRGDSVRNEVVRQELKLEPILKNIDKQQLKWFDHLMRSNNSKHVKKVLQTRMTEKWRRSRPTKTWEHSIEDILREKHVTWNEASKKMQNRKERAKFVDEYEEQHMTHERIKQDKHNNNNYANRYESITSNVRFQLQSFFSFTLTIKGSLITKVK